MICSACCDRVRYIINPPKRLQHDVRRLIELEDNPNILTLAAHNATGDWRRAAIAKRIEVLRRQMESPRKRHRK